MKFRRVVIENYRSIKEADLTLGNITAIVGESDVGKTNLVRAIRDWNYGSIASDATTADSNNSKVSVCVDANIVVSIEKNKKRDTLDASSYGARYVVQDSDTGDNILFEKTGGSVPEQIRELTGLYPFRLADDRTVDLNIAEQGDPWFMLSRPLWSDLTVARLIAKVCGIDSLMRGIKKGKKEAARASGEAKVKKKDMDRLQALIDADSFDEIDETIAVLDQFDAAIKARDTCDKRLAQASDKRREAACAAADLDSLKEFLDVYGLIDQEMFNTYLKRRTRLKDAKEKLKEIARIRNSVIETMELIGDVEDKIRNAKSEMTMLIESGDIICPLCGNEAHDECLSLLEDKYCA